MVDPLFYARAAYILGWTNILGLLLVLGSCRCMISNWGLTKLSQSKIYMKFYRLHHIYWYFFIASVLSHAVLAIITYGVPF